MALGSYLLDTEQIHGKNHPFKTNKPPLLFSGGYHINLAHINASTTRNPYNELLGFVSVAGLTLSIKYLQDSGENRTSLQLDLSKISWDDTYPRKWEFFGGDWQNTNTYHAYGIARFYGRNSNFNTTAVEYKTHDSISCSLSSEGLLTVSFGKSISFVCLRLYY